MMNLNEGVHVISLAKTRSDGDDGENGEADAAATEETAPTPEEE
jgi:hypothetical protein